MKAHSSNGGFLYEKNQIKTIAVLITLGILAFLPVMHYFTRLQENISLAGTLLSIPTFFIYLYIHTSLFKNKHR